MLSFTRFPAGGACVQTVQISARCLLNYDLALESIEYSIIGKYSFMR